MIFNKHESTGILIIKSRSEFQGEKLFSFYAWMWEVCEEFEYLCWCKVEIQKISTFTNKFHLIRQIFDIQNIKISNLITFRGAFQWIESFFQPEFWENRMESSRRKFLLLEFHALHQSIKLCSSQNFTVNRT